MSLIKFDVITQDAAWEGLGLDAAALALRVAHSLPAEVIPPNKQEVSLVLTDDASIRALNRNYRSKDKPTNILSFPTIEAPGLLGDIILARETIIAEAQRADKRLPDHLTHLIIHGLLHLLGYDHIQAQEADIMEAIEIKALAKLGIANPYVLKA